MKNLCFCGSGLPHEDCHAPIEEIIRNLRAEGKRVPTKRMIKNAKQIEGIRKAGIINRLVLDAVAKNFHNCKTTQDIDDIVMQRTKELGAIPACLGYEGFPKSVCTSVNDQVCHGIPSKKVRLREGDIVNVDCTTIYDGYVGDASRMFGVGEISPDAEKLIRVTAEAVDIAVSHIAPYTHLEDIGYYIAEHVHQNGFSVVREIGGHGCGLKMHEDPYVCHVGRLGRGMVLLPGMVFTVEPMVNQGSRYFQVSEKDGWQVRTADGKLSAQVEHMVLVTDSGFEILSR